jgi:thiamine-phosphate pyrophosphorylase
MADRCLLYYITDRSQFSGDASARREALLAKVVEAARAGVDYIQIRERDLHARELLALAREAVTLVCTNSRSTRLLVNSRVDVALAASAGGVHLRSDDISAEEVRRLVKLSADASLTTDRFLIAASCHTQQDVTRAESESADFAVFAPVFGKGSSPGTRRAGLDALREACRAKIPVVALGGITLKNAASCLDAGAAGIAGIRLFQQNTIEDVVRNIVRGLREV